MEKNQEGKAEKFLSDFGKKLDQFFVEAKDASSRAETDLRKKYAELKASAEKIKAEAKDPERWKEVEANLKKAGDELEKAIASAFKKRQEKPLPARRSFGAGGAARLSPLAGSGEKRATRSERPG